MQAHDEFWLTLHDMSFALDSDNIPVKEKAELLASYLPQYPSQARQQIIEDFRFVLCVLMELQGAVTKLENGTDPLPVGDADRADKLRNGIQKLANKCGHEVKVAYANIADHANISVRRR